MGVSLESLVLLGALVVGASLGSFLNVVIARVPEGLSIAKPRSRCPRCLAPIAWYDNVPVLSWLLLRARCRHCAAPISARYPLVELAGAAAALLALRRHGWMEGGGAALSELAFVCLVLALALIDLDTWLLPHALTLPLLGGGLAIALAWPGLGPASSRADALWGAGAGFAAFSAVHYAGKWVFRREAMGFGDVWLLAGLGAWLGLKALLPVVLLASLQGTVVGVVLLLLGKLPKGGGATRTATATSTSTEGPDEWVPPKNAVPFGPFLVAGALEWLYLSERLARLVPTLEVFR